MRNKSIWFYVKYIFRTDAFTVVTEFLFLFINFCDTKTKSIAKIKGTFEMLRYLEIPSDYLKAWRKDMKYFSCFVYSKGFITKRKVHSVCTTKLFSLAPNKLFCDMYTQQIILKEKDNFYFYSYNFLMPFPRALHK